MKTQAESMERSQVISHDPYPLLIATIAAVCIFLSTTKIEFFTGLSLNYLPLQIALSLAAVIFMTKMKKVGIVDLLLFFIIFLILGSRNVYQPASIISNPLIPSLGIMTLVSTVELKIRSLRTTNITLAILCAIVITLQAIHNASFSPVETLNGRFKGFGSGTFYSLISGFIVLYVLDLYKRNSIKLIQALVLLSVPVWTLLLTQSRGVFLSIFIIIIFPYTRTIKGMMGIVGLLLPTMAYVIYFTPLMEYIGLLSRLNFAEYTNIADITSGRFQTQSVILTTILSANSIDSLLFGPEQLNGIKALVGSGLEFPHLDLLYVIYDGGIFALTVYIIMTCKILKKYHDSSYMYLFFLSTLHTNMILSPMFLILAWLLSESRRANMSGNAVRPRKL